MAISVFTHLSLGKFASLSIASVRADETRVCTKARQCMSEVSEANLVLERLGARGQITDMNSQKTAAPATGHLLQCGAKVEHPAATGVDPPTRLHAMY